MFPKLIELVSTHIFHTIERPQADAPVIETLTREQVDKMLKACKASRAWRNRAEKTSERPTAERDQAIIYLLLSTGIRASELCDIDMTQRSITVAGKGRGQGKKQRIVQFGKSTGRAL